MQVWAGQDENVKSSIANLRRAQFYISKVSQKEQEEVKRQDTWSNKRTWK